MLTSKQRSYLRGLAAKEDTILQIGKDGITENTTAALSDAFSLDAAGLFNDLRVCLSLNPIEPRYLREHRFDLFYLNSPHGAVGAALHEIIHFFYFYVWNGLFDDPPDACEAPALPWLLSEMVVEPIMRDERLRSINPYFERENGGCVYPYFYDMTLDGRPLLDTLYEMYRAQPIDAFMRESYAFLQAHEDAVRAHIRRAEQAAT